MAMFGRFTERAQKVIILAQDEAKGLKHNYVGTEHLLLGLVKEGEGIAAKALKNVGIDLNKLREKVVSKVGSGDKEQELLGFTPRTKRVFELSFLEARNLGHNYVGTEHLLLGLIKEGEGIAAITLKEMGIELGKTRDEVIKMLGNNYNNQNKNKYNKKSGKTPTLDQHGTDLT